MKIYDLSVPVCNNSPEPNPPKIEYIDHRAGALLYGQKYGIEADQFPDGKYCAVENVTLNTHSGTHVDSPYHYAEMSEGEKSQMIDQIPLEWFFHDGVVLDFSDKPAGYGITAEDVKLQLDRIGYVIKPYDIVLIRTDNIRKYGMLPKYWNLQPGMTRDATLWLLEQGVRVTGIDAYGWDRPAKFMKEDMDAGQPEKFWEAHFVGKEHAYCHMEKLSHLHLLPKPFGFIVAAFPVKVAKASAGWVRAVAIFDDE